MDLLLIIKIISALLLFFLVMYRPIWGVFSLILLLPFLTNELFYILTVIVIFFVLIYILKNRVWAIPYSPLTLPVIFFILIAIYSTLTSISFTMSLEILIKNVPFILMYFVVFVTVRQREDFDRCLKLFALAAFILSCLGILQYFTLKIDISSWVDRKLNPDLGTRVIGTFGNPNVFAEYLEQILPVAIMLFFVYKNKFNKYLNLLFSTVTFICIVLTFSRGAWLGSAFSLGILFLIYFSKYIPLVFVTGLLSIPFIPSVIIQRIVSITNTSDSSTTWRINVWEGTAHIIKDYWFAGTGYGYLLFRYLYTDYSVRGTIVWHSHNMYLQTLAETGILGLLVLIILLVTIIYTFYKIFKSQNLYYRFVSGGLTAGLLAIFIHGAFEHILYLPKNLFMFWSFLGFISVAYKFTNQVSNS